MLAAKTEQADKMIRLEIVRQVIIPAFIGWNTRLKAP
jgi:hypothetical protein